MSELHREFSWPVRIYYEDTDAGGVVYHAAYLKFMERARTEWLRAMGFEQTRLREELGVLFVIRKINVHYRRPAQLDQLIEVRLRPQRLGRAGFALLQEVTVDDTVLLTADTDIACVHAESMRPARLPEIVRATMEPCLDYIHE